MGFLGFSPDRYLPQFMSGRNKSQISALTANLMLNYLQSQLFSDLMRRRPTALFNRAYKTFF